MTSRNQTTEASLEQFEDSLRKGLHTSYPGSIVSYDPETKTCSVQIHYADFYVSDGPEPIREDWPPLEDVPVCFPRGGGWSITWPLAKGDPVLVLFAERSLQEWFASDGKTDLSPALQVTHNESDALVIAGLYPSKNAEGDASAEHLIISGAKEFQVKADKVRLGTLDAAKALALADDTKARIDALQAKIDLICAGANAAVGAGGLWLTPQTPLGPLAGVASQTVFTDA